RQRHRDTDLASRGGGAAPSDHHTPPRLARSGTACCPCPAATPCTAVSSDRLPPHPAGLAPAPGDEKVDSAAVPRTPAPRGGTARAHHPAWHRESPLGIPSRAW